MAGTKLGGLKAAETNRAKYGDNYYVEIGRKGGRRGHTGGFASNKELAREAGRKGGRKSRREGSAMQKKLKELFAELIYEELAKGTSVRVIAERIGVSEGTLRRFIKKQGWDAKMRAWDVENFGKNLWKTY